MKTKICTKCQKEIPLVEFIAKGSKRNTCQDCLKEYYKSYYANKRKPQCKSSLETERKQRKSLEPTLRQRLNEKEELVSYIDKRPPRSRVLRWWGEE